MVSPLDMMPFSVPGAVSGADWVWSAIGWTITGLCAIFWLVMLVDCLRRPAFYPVLGTSWRTKVFWLVTFVLVNPLITLAYLLFGRLLPPKPRAPWPASVGVVGFVLLLAALQLWPSADLVPQVVRFQRDPDSGEMKLQAGNTSAGLALKAESTGSTASYSSVTSSSGPSDPFFACRHIIILGTCEHPLMQRVAGLLCEKFSGLRFVNSVSYYPPGERPPMGGRTPDMVVVLDAPRISETGLPGARQFTCIIKVSAGPIPWSSGHSYSTDASPPLLDVRYSGKLEHRSRVIGIAAGGERYASTANSIVEQIDGNLLKAIREWSDKYRSPGELPASFYGQYTPPGDSFLSDRPGWKPVLAGSGLFEHNRTVWRFDDERPAAEVLTDIEAQLAAQGFKRRSDDEIYLRMSNHEQEVEVYRLGDHEFHSPEEATTEARSYAAVYRLRFTRQERCRAIEDLLVSADCAEQLVAFRHHARTCSGGLYDRFMERLASLPTTSAGGLLAVAEWRHSRGEREAALAGLRGAAALAWADGRQSDMKRDLEKLGQKLGLKDAASLRPSEDDLVQVGVRALPPDGQAVEGTVAVGEPLRAWLVSAAGDLLAIRCAVLHGEKADQPFRLSITIASSGGSTTSTIGMSPTTTGDGQEAWFSTHSLGYNDVRISATVRSNDGQHFQMAVTLLEDSTPTSAPAAAE